MPKKLESWYQPVAERMVQERMSFRQALTELNIVLTSEEAMLHERGRTFKKILEGETNKYYSDLALDPARGRASLVGEMIYCVRGLVKDGSFDKALDGLFKLAKVEGIIGSETNVNVFANLSQKDVDEAKKALFEQIKAAKEVKQTSALVN